MLPRFISDAKDKHPTFIFTVIRSGMLPRFISDAKDKHPTFIFTVIRSGMLPRFISDAKDKHPTFIFTVIRSGKRQKSGVRLIQEYSRTRHLFLASYGAECYRVSFPTLKTNTQHLFLPSYGAEYSRHSSWIIVPNVEKFIHKKNAATREKSAFFYFFIFFSYQKSGCALYSSAPYIYEIIRYFLVSKNSYL